MSRALLVAALVGACAPPAHAPSPALGQPGAPVRPGSGGRPGPALGVFPPNATRVTARVVARATYQADALPARPPVGEPGRTVEALTIEIQHAAQARPGVAMGPAVGTIEAFAGEALPPVAVGQRIEATVSLVGDTQARRWFISDIRVLAE